MKRLTAEQARKISENASVLSEIYKLIEDCVLAGKNGLIIDKLLSDDIIDDLSANGYNCTKEMVRTSYIETHIRW